ncbi:MAG TPA: HlyD family efflux transporter periplasmic adaptor subunit [Bauldia sp.]|nr:HlyD family efflux transporter periplasmic adaptor subunit [Bauldia sp.]
MTKLHAASLLLLLLLAGCNGSATPALQGYVEGTYVYAAPDRGGRLVERPVAAGDRVAAGTVLARLDDADERQAVAAAEARLAQAEAQLANLGSGKRPEEISVLAAQLEAARTALRSADDEYTRKLVLREKGVVATSVVDDAKSARDSAQAQVDAAERQLDVAKLPARPEEITASERNVAAEKAALEQAKTALARRTLMAPADGVVEETFFEKGELVNAGQPIVSLLPEANRKVRFYLPEPMLASVKVGSPVTITCDGCAGGMSATVTLVATAAEFTPPVLYSRGNREKLVYRVEAKPAGATAGLKVGQPVEVTLPGGGP